MEKVFDFARKAKKCKLKHDAVSLSHQQRFSQMTVLRAAGTYLLADGSVDGYRCFWKPICQYVIRGSEVFILIQ